MNPETGTFVSRDTYSGNTNSPVTLHKYLYANANPVTYSDPSGYCANVIAKASYDARMAMIGNSLINMARALVSYFSGKSLALSLCVATTAATALIMSDVLEGDLPTANDVMKAITDKIRSLINSLSKGKSIAIPKRDLDGSEYYHATTAINAISIVASHNLIGSKWEGGHVYVWGLPPSKQALKLSGAMSAEVLVAFTTTATFIPDPGIDDPVVKFFMPMQSVFPGPIIIKDAIIIPII